MEEERFLDRLDSITEVLLDDDAPRVTWDRPAVAPSPRPAHQPAAGLHTLIEHRLRAVAHPQTLRAAAVLGQTIELDLVAAATERSRGQVRADLDQCVAARLLVPAGATAWRFASPTITEVLKDGVADTERRDMHRRAAEYYEGRAIAPGLPCAASVAHHLLAAGDADPEHLTRWILRGVDEAQQAGAGDPGELCTEALAALGSEPSRPRAELLARLAGLRREGGDEASARALFLAAAEAAEAAGDDELAADAVSRCLPLVELAETLAGTDDTVVRLLESIEQRLPASSPRRGAIESRLAVVLPAAGEQLRRRKTLVMAASRHAQHSGDDGAVATVLGAWLLTHWGPRAAGSRLAAADEMVRRARKARDLELVFDAHRLRRHALLENGDGTAADAELALATRLAHAGSLPHAAGWLAVMQAGRALVEGRFGAAEQLGGEALSSAAGPEPPPWVLHLVGQAFILRREQDQLVDLEPSLRRVAEERREVEFWRAAHACALARAGRTVEARVAVERFLLEGLPVLASDQHWLPTVVLFAEVAIQTGLQSGAPALYAALMPWDGKLAVFGGGSAVIGSVSRVLGQLAALENGPAAADHFRRALETEIRLGAGPLAARTKLAYGATLLSGTTNGDGAAGRRLVAEALDTAVAYGMPGLASEAAAQLEGETTRRAAVTLPRFTPPPSLDAAVPAVVAAPSTGRLRLYCFGPYRLERDGDAIDVSGLKPRVRHLLWLLSLHAGRRVHSDQLIEALWPESQPDSGRRNLQVAVHSLRRFLEPDAARNDWRIVVREGESYGLVVDGESDIARFAAALTAARLHQQAGDTDAALAAYEAAVNCWTGDLIPEAGTADWIVEARRQRRLEAADAATSAAELHLTRGETAAAFALCEKGIELDRYRDRLWRLLVGACDAASDHAAAARAREGYATVLAEFGISTD